MGIVYEVVVLAALIAEEAARRLLQHQQLRTKGFMNIRGVMDPIPFMLRDIHLVIQDICILRWWSLPPSCRRSCWAAPAAPPAAKKGIHQYWGVTDSIIPDIPGNTTGSTHWVLLRCNTTGSTRWALLCMQHRIITAKALKGDAPVVGRS
jgi:hypothetical protein